MTMSTPKALSEIRPEWLTEKLRQHGCIHVASVTGFDVHRIGTEVGFLDGLSRLSLTYDRSESGAPASVVVKLPAADARYRQIGDFYHAYEREVRFYREVAPGSPLRLPRCFCAEMDREGASFLLLMEDMSSLAPGDQVQGLTAAQALAAVETIGTFHATWWESPTLKSLDWMPRRNLQPARYRAAWTRLRETLGPQLSPAALALGETLDTHIEVLLDQLDAMPPTIAHSDFRADNLLFSDLSSPQPVVVLDWQLAIRNAGVMDVARLLCGSTARENRAACEYEALRRWHAALVAGGVGSYSLEQAFEDYRRCALVCLYFPVTIHEAEEAAGARGAALAHAQIERFFTAALELDAASFLTH